MRLAAVLCLALAGPAAADPFAQAIAAFRAGDAGRAAVIFNPHSPSKSLILLSGSQYFRYKSWC
ncbi:hypothetical protein SAMN05878503_101435 [Cereibacter ovatus]|uniref:Uncharacterized protein n=1 Tax=Cereibacter ovatus TaxID=439529 RepID=A0A285CJM8_9RHOB|nr:hypothetical protein SAMN05878503_101435 [Cereibacter ovatus]